MNRPSAKQLQKWTQKISESDKEAFNSLFRYLYPQLLHFSMRYTHNKAAAADLTQDAFVRLWNMRRDLDRDFKVKAYLYRMVRNSSLNYIRDHSSKTVGLEEIDMETETKMEMEIEEPRLENPGENSDTDLRMELLRSWIEELPDRRREAFELSRFEGLNHDEIAEVMEISSNTVNNHIVAALEFLKDRYHEYKEKQTKI